MSLSSIRLTTAILAVTCCLVGLTSCSRSPTGPGGLLVVHVSLNGDGPSPGKSVEVLGTHRVQVTDQLGLAAFVVPAGDYVVRAYAIGTPGPGLPYVDQNVTIAEGRTTRVEFNDCTACR